MYWPLDESMQYRNPLPEPTYIVLPATAGDEIIPAGCGVPIGVDQRGLTGVVPGSGNAKRLSSAQTVLATNTLSSPSATDDTTDDTGSDGSTISPDCHSISPVPGSRQKSLRSSPPDTAYTASSPQASVL